MRIRVLKLAGVYLLAMGLAAAVSPPAPAQPPASGWGLEQGQPVEVCKPQGQRAWLAQLQCADGSELSWRRAGSVGPRSPLPAEMPMDLMEKYISGAALAPGEPDYHMIDGYQVDCGGNSQLVYLDMYHCDGPAVQRAPAGFVLAASDASAP